MSSVGLFQSLRNIERPVLGPKIWPVILVSTVKKSANEGREAPRVGALPIFSIVFDVGVRGQVWSLVVVCGC